MKIRKTVIEEQEVHVYIYENKKEEYILVALPEKEWSFSFSYEEAGEELNQKLKHSLTRVVSDQEAYAMALRIAQWTREM
ncbi:hypothetical protein J2S13_001257 [Oikeobacillus pervagus]|uniref:YueH-like protein n=1 Tax=Oikeobacillus pervagus TaxID=1325931 RepID=A0AAJ1WIP5_9BACI|nr:YueH family protein [Oikeobacillus pervagus]MDQ0214860.1 hypothetical protein [Oikeobacillus pervagus]